MRGSPEISRGSPKGLQQIKIPLHGFYRTTTDLQTWILEPTWTCLCTPNRPKPPAPPCSGDLESHPRTEQEALWLFGNCCCQVKALYLHGPCMARAGICLPKQELLHLPGLPAPPSCSDLESRPSTPGSMDIAPLEVSELPVLFQRNKPREMTQRRHLCT